MSRTQPRGDGTDAADESLNVEPPPASSRQSSRGPYQRSASFVAKQDLIECSIHCFEVFLAVFFALFSQTQLCFCGRTLNQGSSHRALVLFQNVKSAPWLAFGRLFRRQPVNIDYRKRGFEIARNIV